MVVVIYKLTRITGLVNRKLLLLEGNTGLGSFKPQVTIFLSTYQYIALFLYVSVLKHIIHSRFINTELKTNKNISYA
jgi:hypothetical protein